MRTAGHMTKFLSLYQLLASSPDKPSGACKDSEVFLTKPDSRSSRTHYKVMELVCHHSSWTGRFRAGEPVANPFQLLSSDFSTWRTRSLDVQDPYAHPQPSGFELAPS
jgi:hypothetical protein